MRYSVEDVVTLKDSLHIGPIDIPKGTEGTVTEVLESMDSYVVDFPQKSDVPVHDLQLV